MDLVVVTDVTQCLVDIRRGALLVRIKIVDKSHPHSRKFKEFILHFIMNIKVNQFQLRFKGTMFIVTSVIEG